VLLKNSALHGIRLALAYQMGSQRQAKNSTRSAKLQEFCCDFLSCMDLDPAKSIWTAVHHNASSPQGHIHLTMGKDVKRGI
jgi:hypothetical protein